MHNFRVPLGICDVWLRVRPDRKTPSGLHLNTEDLGPARESADRSALCPLHPDGVLRACDLSACMFPPCRLMRSTNSLKLLSPNAAQSHSCGGVSLQIDLTRGMGQSRLRRANSERAAFLRGGPCIRFSLRCYLEAFS
jgi:hypothetical protein